MIPAEKFALIRALLKPLRLQFGRHQVVASYLTHCRDEADMRLSLAKLRSNQKHLFQ